VAVVVEVVVVVAVVVVVVVVDPHLMFHRTLWYTTPVRCDRKSRVPEVSPPSVPTWKLEVGTEHSSIIRRP
jgi:hypothetical protein